jgi:hypothetical protein
MTMPASGRIDVHPPPLRSELSVTDLSAVGDEVWAVGMGGAPAPARIGHTAGGEPWQLVSYSSSSEAVHTQLADVHATASGDVWAVGQDQDPGHAGGALILHYDGDAWAPTETPVVGQASLSDVACAGRDNVWAVGFQDPENGAFGPLILHFDGSVWAVVEPPATATRTSLQAVTALPGGAAWVAGFARSTPGDSGYTVPLVMSTEGGR